MLNAPTPYRHVVVDEDGHARLEGTRHKVLMLGLEQEEHGWSPAEMKWQHPDLSLAQIHSALAYYYDHLGPMRELAEQRRQAESAFREQEAIPLSRRDLQERGA